MQKSRTPVAQNFFLAEMLLRRIEKFDFVVDGAVRLILSGEFRKVGKWYRLDERGRSAAGVPGPRQPLPGFGIGGHPLVDALAHGRGQAVVR